MSKPFDVVVVGSGPGGATVARELSRRGKRVQILEWGAAGLDRGTAGEYLREQLLTGRGLLFTNGMLAIVRGITSGGSSMFYYATAFPAPLEMLKTYGVDISDEVNEARRELEIRPLEGAMLTPMSRRIMESARELGFDWRPLDKFIHHERWKPDDQFGYFGEPNRVKWTAREYIEEAVSNGAVLVNGARVSRVLVEGGVATGVEYLQYGEPCRTSAETVVIAAGGIGSPQILRASGISDAGFDFFFDPLITVCGTVEDVATQTNEIPMSAGVLLRDEGFMMTDMAVPRLTHNIFEASVGRFDMLFAHGSTARILVKARDSLGGRVTARGGVRKKLTESDRQKLMTGYGHARRILQNMGAKRIHRSWYAAAHPGGTVKIGHLLDSTLMTEVDKLYVCDCSVIPEEWGLPPTLTIIGLGKYLAKHLLGTRTAADSVATERTSESLPAGCR